MGIHGDPVPLTSIESYRGTDGNIDWRRYHAAQRANGEICNICDKHILSYGTRGSRSECGDCKEIKEDDDEIVYNERIRCPKCRNSWDPYEGEDYDCLEDGDHDVMCIECDHTFRITTYVSWSFNSPAMIKEEEHVTKFYRCRDCGVTWNDGDGNGEDQKDFLNCHECNKPGELVMAEED